MADNVGYTPGAGADIAADDVGGVLYQRVKVAVGADGVADDVSSGNPLPVVSATQDAKLDSLLAAQPSRTPSGGQLIGTNKDKFRDQFPDLANWNIVQTGGMTHALVGDTQGARSWQISSGVTNGAELIAYAVDDDGTPIIVSSPVRVVVGVSTSQAIAGSELHFELVECDDAGALVTDTTLTTAPTFNNARNGVGIVWDGTSQNNARYKIRSQGLSELTPAAASFGTSSRVAAGTTPNFTAAYQTEIMMLTDMVTVTSRAVNSTSAGNVVVNRTDTLPNPDRKYRVQIRVKNVSVPASSTDFRIHFLRLIDASRVSVDFGVIGGNSTDALSAPVKMVGSVSAVLTASTAAVGKVAPTGIWYDDSSTALAASATFTGSSRDVLATASASAFSAATVYLKEFRVAAESDQAGVLWIEVSRDNILWRRVKSVATSAVVGGGQYAELTLLPVWRYARAGFTNGAVAQARFMIGSMAVGG